MNEKAIDKKDGIGGKYTELELRARGVGKFKETKTHD
jgi:hypothetical protein